MKKYLSILLSLTLVFSTFTAAFGATASETTLNFNLTCGNKNYIIVPAETDVTVTYTLENVTENASYNIQSVTNVIAFDDEFFEYNKDAASPIGQNTSEQETSYGQKMIYFNADANPYDTYAAKQTVGTFSLKVKATEGSSVIYIEEATAYDVGEKSYKISTSSLTVQVGDPSQQGDYYTVSYVNNNVTNKVFASGSVTLASEPAPIVLGAQFLGWEAPDGTLYQPGDVFALSNDITFKAKWDYVKEKYTITFNSNGGSTVSSVEADEGTVINLSSYTTTKTDYTFDGWYTDSAFSGSALSTITLNSDVTLYAKWSADDDGDGDGNGGGGGGGGGGTGGSGSTDSGSTDSGSTDSGSTDSGSTGNTSSATVSGGSVTRYKLSFETNGGTAVNSVSKVRNTTVDLSKYITQKTGYSFDGWYTDKELTNRVATVKMESNTTLYAKWIYGNNGYVPNPSYKPDIFTSEHTAYIVGREGGYIAPNANLTRAEAATMFFRLVDAQVLIEGMTKKNRFTDVNEGDWFNTAISTLTNLEVLNGRTANTFEPNATITRAEFMTIVSRLSEATYDGADIFIDIAGHWAREYINIAASIAWTNGDNGMFRPDDNVTRAEAMTIINRALNRLPEDTSDLLEGMEVFVDNSDASAWYYLNIQEATNSHDFVIKADNVHEKWTSLKENPNWTELEG